MRAYRELSRSRPSDMGAGRPVPITEIESYCRLFRITNMEEIENLFLFVGRMDQTLMEHIQKKTLQDDNQQS